MKINIDEIPKDGLHFKKRYDSSQLHLEAENLHLDSPISAVIDLKRVNNDVLADVDFMGIFRATCSRCLEEFVYNFNKKAKFSYRVKDANIIDVSEDLRQEIILNFPIKLLCKPDCKGLCSVCGQNFNKKECGHTQKSNFGLKL